MRYLSDIRQSLPENCLYNKVICGCGATTLALTCDDDFIVLEPSLATVQCKVASNPDVFGVYAGVTVDAIRRYCMTHKGPRKIISTYDGFKKIYEALGGNTRQYRLLIDEVQKFTDYYLLKTNEVSFILKHFREFRSFLFMSATLIDRKYQPTEFDDIPVETQDWGSYHIEPIKLNTQKVRSTKTAIAAIVNHFLNNPEYGNAHIFVNSVQFITDIMDECRLNADQCRVICGSKSAARLSDTYGSCVAKITDPVKKINFYTSAMFEGADIYDAVGKTIVVSNNNAAHELIDIMTDIPQIAGRCRNSKYINQILHLYSTTRYNLESREDFIARCQVEIADGERWIAEATQFVMRGTNNVNYRYLRKCEDGLWVYDENCYRYDLRSYDKINYFMNEITVNRDAANDDVHVFDDICLSSKRSNSQSFKDIAIEIEQNGADGVNVAKRYKSFFPFIVELAEIGMKRPALWSRLKTEHYNVAKAQQIVTEMSNKSIDDKIRQSMKLRPNERISRADAKARLQKVYDMLGITYKASASQLEKLYNVKPTQWMSDNNAKVNGYICLS